MSASPVDVALYAHLDDTSSDISSIGSPSDDEEEDEPGGGQGSGGDQDDEAQSKLIIEVNNNIVASSASASSTSTSTSSGLCSLGSLASLEDSLPLKKGLSNHYTGKSRSFSILAQCGDGNAADLAKPENPFNKRRRVQIQSRLSYKRRASCSALIMTELPPLRLLDAAAAADRGVVEEGDREDDDDDDDSGGTPAARSFPLFDV